MPVLYFIMMHTHTHMHDFHVLLIGLKDLILGTGTTNWAVLRECGHEPLQFFWFRSAVKLFNSMANTNSDTLRRVVQADLNLQPRSSACWTAQLLSAFQGPRGCELYVRAVQTGTSCSNCYSHARVYCRFEA